MTVINPDDTTLDAVAERIFREADGDRKCAYKLVRECAGREYVGQEPTGPKYFDLFHRVTQKFVVIEEAAAERIYAEAAGNRDRADQLLRGLTELKCGFEVKTILQRKFQAADNEAADAIADRCYAEAYGDHRLGYQLANDYTADRDKLFADRVRDRLKKKFIVDTTDQIDGHPFNGQRKSFGILRNEFGAFASVGIEADGQLINPRAYPYPEDQLQKALRRAAAEEIETRREASSRAVVTRARRQSKLIHEIANGIRGGKKYGPRNHCLLCKKALSDPLSVSRGVGPECWDGILNLIERTKDAEAQATE